MSKKVTETCKIKNKKCANTRSCAYVRDRFHVNECEDKDLRERNIAYKREMSRRRYTVAENPIYEADINKDQIVKIILDDPQTTEREALSAAFSFEWNEKLFDNADLKLKVEMKDDNEVKSRALLIRDKRTGTIVDTRNMMIIHSKDNEIKKLRKCYSSEDFEELGYSYKTLLIVSCKAARERYEITSKYSIMQKKGKKCIVVAECDDKVRFINYLNTYK